MSTEKELRRLKQQLQDYQQENQNLQREVKKWSQYCAYVAGTSLGIILFLQIFATSEPEVVECPECEECTICEECEVCLEPTVCPEPIECPEPKTKATPPKQNTVVSIPKNVDPTTFPRTYTIQQGDNFSKIAQKIYGRASWAQWLADQNGIDPSKLQIGQEITLPLPKE
jgi:hypothetical protein